MCVCVCVYAYIVLRDVVRVENYGDLYESINCNQYDLRLQYRCRATVLLLTVQYSVVQCSVLHTSICVLNISFLQDPEHLCRCVVTIFVIPSNILIAFLMASR